MRVSDFNYELPAELIAQYPTAERSASRLLCVDGAAATHADRLFRELPELLRAGDLLVFNDTRVIPARVFGFKETGGKVEVLIERILDEQHALAQVRASKTLKAGAYIALEGGVRAEVIGRADALFELRFHDARPVLQVLDEIGRVPLPPYIDRADEHADRERYQTIFAQRPGAVAAPTAGLHFDAALLERIKERGVEVAMVTLHVGAGTFQPVRTQELQDHRMHAEYVDVSAQVCEKVRATRAQGGRVIAVGTTSVRSLESASESGRIYPYAGETRLFIYPGYTFRSVDAMITNFHLPRSTLLMLVCAFAGHENVMTAYRHAVQQKYRFFSYGDAQWVLPSKR